MIRSLVILQNICNAGYFYIVHLPKYIRLTSLKAMKVWNLLQKKSFIMCWMRVPWPTLSASIHNLCFLSVVGEGWQTQCVEYLQTKETNKQRIITRVGRAGHSSNWVKIKHFSTFLYSLHVFCSAYDILNMEGFDKFCIRWLVHYLAFCATFKITCHPNKLMTKIVINYYQILAMF